GVVQAWGAARGRLDRWSDRRRVRPGAPAGRPRRGTAAVAAARDRARRLAVGQPRARRALGRRHRPARLRAPARGRRVLRALDHRGRAGAGLHDAAQPRRPRGRSPQRRQARPDPLRGGHQPLGPALGGVAHPRWARPRRGDRPRPPGPRGRAQQPELRGAPARPAVVGAGVARVEL
ncbi:MAG: hypothetical protein AVDCRST_MAG54-4000, partial [uncultured Actinomycetospora sp.]